MASKYVAVMASYPNMLQGYNIQGIISEWRQSC